MKILSQANFVSYPCHIYFMLCTTCLIFLFLYCLLFNLLFYYNCSLYLFSLFMAKYNLLTYLLTYLLTQASPNFNIIDSVGLKLLTRLRSNLSHLMDHKFQHNFSVILNPLCSCNIEIESTSHYLLRCSFFTPIGKMLLENIIELVVPISNLSEDQQVNLVLDVHNCFCFKSNKSMLKRYDCIH